MENSDLELFGDQDLSFLDEPDLGNFDWSQFAEGGYFFLPPQDNEQEGSLLHSMSQISRMLISNIAPDHDRWAREELTGSK